MTKMKKPYLYIAGGLSIIVLSSAWYFWRRGKGKSKYEKV